MHSFHIDQINIPGEIQKYLRDTDIEDVSCHSSAITLYLSGGHYLKIDQTGKLKQEACLMQWFYRQKIGVRLIRYISAEYDFLLSEAANGQDATKFLSHPDELCATLVRAMKKLHALPMELHPIRNKNEVYLIEVEKRYHAGYFDNQNILSKYRPVDREQAWNRIITYKHLLCTNAIVHGDYCLPNIILHQGNFSSFIDVGMSGAGDCHIDIYWLMWSFHLNTHTEKYSSMIMELYGREYIHEEILALVAACECFG